MLYVGQKNEVFFFYKEVRKGADRLRIAQLQLDTIKNTKGALPKMSRDCSNNCKIDFLEVGSLLKSYIEELN